MSVGAWDPERPWARQPFDTDLGFALFSDYLAQSHPRTLQPLFGPGRPLSWAQLDIIARECHWWARAALWDDHLANLRISTIERVTEETAEDVARRQLGLTRVMQRLASKELVMLEKAVDKANGFPGTITPREAMRLADIGIKLERLIMGESTDRTEVAGPDLSAYSVEDLRALRELQAKAGVR